jgi:hypothetical protein
LRAVLPLKKVIEKSWSSGRLSLTVPWVVEFMKMIIYDTSWRCEQPYEDVLGLLKSIQRSDLFHIKYGNISSNRLYIIIEIQDLWSVLTSYTVNRSGHLPKLTKSQLSTSLNGQNQMIDDENSSFSPSFLKLIVPFFNELLKLMKKRKKDNKPNIKSSSSNSNTNIRPKRQTPTIITNSSIVGSNISNCNSLTQLNQSTVTFNSVAATSVNNNINNSFISAANGSQFRPYSPTQVSSASKQRSSKYSSGGKKFPSSPISSPASLQRSFSSPPTSIGSLALNTSSSSLDSFNHTIVPVSERLITSFWQQHPQLLQISAFILNHLRHSCLAHLRERVGDSIRELWNRSANIKVEIEEDINNALLSQTNTKETDVLVKFQSLLSAEVKHMHKKTLNDGKSFLDEFTSKTLDAIIPELCTLYPCHMRVSNLAIYLIKMQGRYQSTPLMNFLSSYSHRKLDEVYNISVKQYQKIVDGKNLTSTTINTESLAANNNNNKIINKNSYSTQLQPGIICSKLEDNNYEFSINKDKIIEKVNNLMKHIISKYPTSIINLNESYNNIDKLIDKFINQNEDMETFLKDFIQMSINHLKDKIVPKFKFRNYILLLLESIQKLLLVISSCSHYTSILPIDDDDNNEIKYVNFLIITMKNSLYCLEILFEWLRTNIIIDEFHYFDAFDPDMKGKLVIDIVKFFTLSLPSLLYLDAFVRKSIIVDNKLIIDKLYYPSDCLLKVTRNRLINSNSLIRLLKSTCRPSTVSYYESCKELVGFKLIIKLISLDLIGRYLSSRTDLGLDINSYTSSSLAAWTGDSEESWYNDPSTRYSIKTLFGSELSSLITQLAKD